jgi:hypothetical protein
VRCQIKLETYYSVNFESNETKCRARVATSKQRSQGDLVFNNGPFYSIRGEKCFKSFFYLLPTQDVLNLHSCSMLWKRVLNCLLNKTKFNFFLLQTIAQRKEEEGSKDFPGRLLLSMATYTLCLSSHTNASFLHRVSCFVSSRSVHTEERVIRSSFSWSFPNESVGGIVRC